MRVGLISRVFFPSTKGGAERYIYEVAKAIDLMGHEVSTLSWQDSDLAFHSKVNLPSIRYVTHSLFPLYVRKWVAQQDLVILNQYWGEYSPLVINKPFIPILHDVGLFTSDRNESIRNYLRRQILKRAVKRAKAIVVPSEMVKAEVVEHLNVEPSKIEVVLEGGHLPDSELPPIKSDTPVVLTVGRFAPNKGQRELIEAFNLVQEKLGCQLWVAGYVGKPYQDYFDEIARQTGPNITLFSNIEDEKLVQLYKSADLFVAPSLSEEGWGISLTEALRFRLPAVCSDLFEKTGVASNDRALIVDRTPRETYSERLAEGIAALLDDEAQRREYAGRGGDWADALSWAATAKDIMRIAEGI